MLNSVQFRVLLGQGRRQLSHSPAPAPGFTKQMGVLSLAQKAKSLASVRVTLNDGQDRDHVIIDGGFLNHRMCTRKDAATTLLFDDDIEPLARAHAEEVKKFEARRFRVTVVFDGASAPAKRGTSDDRTRKRAEYAAAARLLAKKDGARVEVNRLASNACVFDSRVNARLAMRLREMIRGEVYIAPGEADPQLVLLQDIHLKSGANVYVYATDSDLIVLGVKSLLYEVSERNRQLSGMFIKTDALFQPTATDLRRAATTTASSFLRLVHGLPADSTTASMLGMTLCDKRARNRLLLYAIVVGNDYAKFAGIGPAAAGRLVSCLTRNEQPASPSSSSASDEEPPMFEFEEVEMELCQGVVREASLEDTAYARREVTGSLRAAYNMFRHALVWNPVVDELQHFSGADSITEITRHTGQRNVLYAVTHLLTADW